MAPIKIKLQLSFCWSTPLIMMPITAVFGALKLHFDIAVVVALFQAAGDGRIFEHGWFAIGVNQILAGLHAFDVLRVPDSIFRSLKDLPVGECVVVSFRQHDVGDLLAAVDRACLIEERAE